MVGKHNNPVLGWRPPLTLKSRFEAEVKRRGGGRGIKTAALNEALANWLAQHEPETTSPESEER